MAMLLVSGRDLRLNGNGNCEIAGAFFGWVLVAFYVDRIGDA